MNEHKLERDGFGVLRQAVSSETIKQLLRIFDVTLAGDSLGFIPDIASAAVR